MIILEWWFSQAWCLINSCHLRSPATRVARSLRRSLRVRAKARWQRMAQTPAMLGQYCDHYHCHHHISITVFVIVVIIVMIRSHSQPALGPGLASASLRERSSSAASVPSLTQKNFKVTVCSVCPGVNILPICNKNSWKNHKFDHLFHLKNLN